MLLHLMTSPSHSFLQGVISNIEVSNASFIQFPDNTIYKNSCTNLGVLIYTLLNWLRTTSTASETLNQWTSDHRRSLAFGSSPINCC